MEKKNNSNIIIIIVVVVALIALIVIKNTTKKVPAPIDENTIQLQEAVNSDKTTDITTNLNEIKVEDTTDAELDSIDKELQNL